VGVGSLLILVMVVFIALGKIFIISTRELGYNRHMPNRSKPIPDDRNLLEEVKIDSLIAGEGDYEKSLSPSERIFLVEYLRTWDVMASARAAGCDDPTYYEASALFQRIRPAVNERMRGAVMNEDELMMRLVEVARGLRPDEIDKFGFLEFKKLKERGRTHIIKKVSRNMRNVTVEMHDSMKALELLGRIMGVIKDRTEHMHDGKITVEYPQLNEVLEKVYGKRALPMGEDVVESEVIDAEFESE
jgi:hypothetical protein